LNRTVVIGDSHSQLFSNIESLGRGVWDDPCCDIFDVRWIGPVTYFRLCRDKNDFIDFNRDIIYNSANNSTVSTRIEKGGSILLSLGEIDIRCNIHKHGDYRVTIDKMSDEIDSYVNQYIDDFDLHLCSILPPINKNNCISENKEFPFIGTDEERRDSTIYFNEKLLGISKKYRIGYFDVYSLYKNEYNMLDIEKSDNIVHAKKTKELEKYIREYGK